MKCGFKSGCMRVGVCQMFNRRVFGIADPPVASLTEDEHIKMAEVGDEFWHEFSALCNRYIAKAPSHLREHYTMFLGEKTSIYGRDTS